MTTQPSSTSHSHSHSSAIFKNYSSSSQPSSSSAPTFLRNTIAEVQYFFRQGFQRLLIAAVGSSEPIVKQKCDRHGQTYYTIYDPVTQQRTVCASESEVRAWLDERYYR